MIKDQLQNSNIYPKNSLVKNQIYYRIYPYSGADIEEFIYVILQYSLCIYR